MKNTQDIHQKSLKDQLDQIDIKLRHAVRADTMRECYRNDQEIPFEALRAKTQYNRFMSVIVEQDNRGTRFFFFNF
jgi:hypothetical protein